MFLLYFSLPFLSLCVSRVFMCPALTVTLLLSAAFKDTETCSYFTFQVGRLQINAYSHAPRKIGTQPALLSLNFVCYPPFKRSFIASVESSFLWFCRVHLWSFAWSFLSCSAADKSLVMAAVFRKNSSEMRDCKQKNLWHYCCSCAA